MASQPPYAGRNCAPPPAPFPPAPSAATPMPSTAPDAAAVPLPRAPLLFSSNGCPKGTTASNPAAAAALPLQREARLARDTLRRPRGADDRPPDASSSVTTRPLSGAAAAANHTSRLAPPPPPSSRESSREKLRDLMQAHPIDWDAVRDAQREHYRSLSSAHLPSVGQSMGSGGNEGVGAATGGVDPQAQGGGRNASWADLPSATPPPEMRAVRSRGGRTSSAARAAAAGLGAASSGGKAAEMFARLMQSAPIPGSNAGMAMAAAVAPAPPSAAAMPAPPACPGLKLRRQGGGESSSAGSQKRPSPDGGSAGNGDGKFNGKKRQHGSFERLEEMVVGRMKNPTLGRFDALLGIGASSAQEGSKQKLKLQPTRTLGLVPRFITTSSSVDALFMRKGNSAPESLGESAEQSAALRRPSVSEGNLARAARAAAAAELGSGAGGNSSGRHQRRSGRGGGGGNDGGRRGVGESSSRHGLLLVRKGRSSAVIGKGEQECERRTGGQFGRSAAAAGCNGKPRSKSRGLCLIRRSGSSALAQSPKSSSQRQLQKQQQQQQQEGQSAGLLSSMQPLSASESGSHSTSLSSLTTLKTSNRAKEFVAAMSTGIATGKAALSNDPPAAASSSSTAPSSKEPPADAQPKVYPGAHPLPLPPEKLPYPHPWGTAPPPGSKIAKVVGSTPDDDASPADSVTAVPIVDVTSVPAQPLVLKPSSSSSSVHGASKAPQVSLSNVLAVTSAGAASAISKVEKGSAPKKTKDPLPGHHPPPQEPPYPHPWGTSPPPSPLEVLGTAPTTASTVIGTAKLSISVDDGDGGVGSKVSLKRAAGLTRETGTSPDDDDDDDEGQLRKRPRLEENGTVQNVEMEVVGTTATTAASAVMDEN